MSIIDYASLQTAVAGWLGRTDLTTRITDCISLFEAFANRALRVRQMELTTTLTPVNGSVALPSDYLAWRRLTWTGATRRELEFVHPSYLQAAFPTTPQDIPRYFTIEGANIEIRPFNATALEFDYYQKIPALSASTTTNWLLTAHPDLYLFGTLTEAEMSTVNDERAGSWKSRRDEVVDQIAWLDKKTRGPGAIRVMGWTP